ncbi:LacI family DNA-binding transcriptional regulator [Rubinisphaera margarita]|uniref:LacI family DNA-binding transcriptional regulator n=1 Tax=Rubinisphaera margarita TaxID=2909586 RepID=UPI001EE89E86|nr:LacI family DNA-binding transcriptional regulator [Rubinisphaera margarita]MCG6155178.1 LacI family transcriptional regulator [Rubinisphaera margarita]
MSSSPSTLQQVADAAGVSVSTASRALAGKAREYRISSRTEAAVQQAAQKLKFRPSRTAQALRSQKTGLLGVVVPDVANPFFAAIAREVTRAAEENGYAVLLADTGEQTATEQRAVEQFLSRQVEGLVVCPVGHESRHLQRLEAAGIPLVHVDRGFSDGSTVTVTSEHTLGAAQLTRLLIEAGHRHIGIVQGEPGTLPNEERLEGVQSEFERAGIEWDPEQIVGTHFSEESGYRAAGMLLKSGKKSLTALFAFSNQIALGCMRAIREAELTVPGDLSLVTFDDHPFAEYVATPLTVASQNVSEIGRTAARLLIDQMTSGKKPRKKVHRIPVQIHQRGSIASIES